MTDFFFSIRSFIRSGVELSGLLAPFALYIAAVTSNPWVFSNQPGLAFYKQQLYNKIK